MEKQPERKLKGPWKSVHTAIWLVGLAILALNDWWWPGILFLVALSMISQAVIQMMAPKASELGEQANEERIAGEVIDSSLSNTEAHKAAYSNHRLPTECPKCGVPIRGVDIRWTGPDSADCPYCGANLPLH